MLMSPRRNVPKRVLSRCVLKIIAEGSSNVGAQARAALDDVNAMRADVDAKPLRLSDPLTWTAQCFAEVMDDISDDRPFYALAERSGFNGQVALLTALALNWESALEMFVRSTDHRRVLLGEATVLGYGRAGIGWVICVA